jgi:hypothetical protein
MPSPSRAAEMGRCIRGFLAIVKIISFFSKNYLATPGSPTLFPRISAWERRSRAQNGALRSVVHRSAHALTGRAPGRPSTPARLRVTMQGRRTTYLPQMSEHASWGFEEGTDSLFALDPARRARSPSGSSCHWPPTSPAPSSTRPTATETRSAERVSVDLSISLQNLSL